MRKFCLSLAFTLVALIAVAAPVLADTTGPGW